MASDPNTSEPPAAAASPKSADAQPAGATAGAKSGDNGPRNQGKRKQHVGRSEWRRQQTEKRKQQLNEDWTSKRRKVDTDDPRKANPFSAEEIAAEARRPKKKVAVMIGYSGTGYKGMQINWDEKTIEGDIFKAFIAAGAIAKANADDPKKSSLARCARTDKGVHAAGNVISLKLIIEDDDVVDKINANLPEQIRVWDIQRTNNAFSCYAMCDSRWYEYLLPTYCLLPPHPESYLFKKLAESARGNDSYDDFSAQFDDVKGFWEDVEEKSIKPILERLEPDVRAEVLGRIHVMDDTMGVEDQTKPATTAGKTTSAKPDAGEAAGEPSAQPSGEPSAEPSAEPSGDVPPSKKPRARELTAVDFALRDIKAAYVKAKRAYRVTPERLQRLQDALSQYVGTVNFHNYTIQKSYGDASAKRHIKSFDVNMTPIQIRDTQWVSLKVHGQSFMMHQIRKMVSMAALLVRCGTPLSLMKESFGDVRIAIPKAPGLGLLLERPVFDGYNRKAVDQLKRETISFDKYEDKIQAFKDKEIYQRIFEVEEEDSTFHTFFEQVDNFRSDYFLWLCRGGIQAAAIRPGKGDAEKAIDAGMGDEDEDPEGGEG